MFNRKKVKELELDNARLLQVINKQSDALKKVNDFLVTNCYFRNKKGQIQKVLKGWSISEHGTFQYSIKVDNSASFGMFDKK